MLKKLNVLVSTRAREWLSVCVLNHYTHSHRVCIIYCACIAKYAFAYLPSFDDEMIAHPFNLAVRVLKMGSMFIIYNYTLYLLTHTYRFGIMGNTAQRNAHIIDWKVSWAYPFVCLSVNNKFREKVCKIINWSGQIALLKIILVGFFILLKLHVWCIY